MLEDLRPHLVELRKRLTISVVAFVVIFMAMFTYNQPLLEWITAPLHDALVNVGKIAPLAARGMMTTNQVGGAFFVAMKVSFFASIVASLPVILSQIWLFVAPGLYENEKKMLIPFVFGFLALLGLITDKTLIDFFRYAIVLIFIIAALLTPPDVMTQLLMAFPLIILYGISIIIVRFVNPASKEDVENDIEEEVEQKEENKKLE